MIVTMENCHERPPPVRNQSGPSRQVAAGYRGINTAKTVVGTLQKWSATVSCRSPKGPAVSGTRHTVLACMQLLRLFCGKSHALFSKYSCMYKC